MFSVGCFWKHFCKSILRYFFFPLGFIWIVENARERNFSSSSSKFF